MRSTENAKVIREQTTVQYRNSDDNCRSHSAFVNVSLIATVLAGEEGALPRII